MEIQKGAIFERLKINFFLHFFVRACQHIFLDDFAFRLQLGATSVIVRAKTIVYFQGTDLEIWQQCRCNFPSVMCARFEFVT
jgi:hypothetical protein